MTNYSCIHELEDGVLRLLAERVRMGLWPYIVTTTFASIRLRCPCVFLPQTSKALYRRDEVNTGKRIVRSAIRTIPMLSDFCNPYYRVDVDRLKLDLCPAAKRIDNDSLTTVSDGISNKLWHSALDVRAWPIDDAAVYLREALIDEV